MNYMFFSNAITVFMTFLWDTHIFASIAHALHRTTTQRSWSAPFDSSARVTAAPLTILDRLVFVKILAFLEKIVHLVQHQRDQSFSEWCKIKVFFHLTTFQFSFRFSIY